MNRGFTLVELIVSIGIFILMTSLIVAKFGTFNQSTLLTDTAYDVALTARLAQTYGLSVKNAAQTGSPNFNVPYGLDFTTGSAQTCGAASLDAGTFGFFGDAYPGTPDGHCGGNDILVSSYAITRGARVTTLCAGSDATSCASAPQVRLDVSYQRPSPEAVICGSTDYTNFTCTYTYAEVWLTGTDGGVRKIIFRQNGQIAVDRNS